MISLGFLHQALLWGTALAVVPLIIHLLFRRRFLRIDWAPMHYLKLSIRKNRRRIRLEQLLLLLVRMALVALLFVTVARPLVRASGMGDWLGLRGRVSRILVIDDSLSMGHSDGSETALRRAQRLALGLIRAIGPQDRLTLVQTSEPRRPLVREVELFGTNQAQVVSALNGLNVADSATRWKTTLEAIDDLVSTSTHPLREVVIVTDLRKSGWDDALASLGTRWARARVRLRIYDVGAEPTENLAVVGLEPERGAIVTGIQSRFQALVRNDRAGEAAGVEAKLAVDGKANPVRLPNLPPGQTTKVPLTATFQEPGPHRIQFSFLAHDDLPGDDQRWLTVQARDQLKVVLVDGKPSEQPFEGAADFLELALTSGGGADDPWQIEKTTDVEWEAAPLGKPDVVILSNVGAVSRPRAEALARAVRAGMGLIVIVGDQVLPETYNTTFGTETGLLPGRLEDVVEDQITGLTVEKGERHSLIALADLAPAALARVRVKRFMSTALPRGEAAAVRILARWNHPSGAAAVLEKTVGRGRVQLWTTSANTAWTDWPKEPSYVLAVREATMQVANPGDSAPAFVAGQPLRRGFKPGEVVSNPLVRVPGLETPQPLTVEPPAQPDDGIALVWPQTRRAGWYGLSWLDRTNQPRTDTLAVNPDPRESDLRRITPAEVKALFGSLRPEVIRAGAGDDTSLAVQGKEAWRSLALTLLILLACEACLATWVGRQR